MSKTLTRRILRKLRSDREWHPRTFLSKIGKSIDVTERLNFLRLQGKVEERIICTGKKGAPVHLWRAT